MWHKAFQGCAPDFHSLLAKQRYQAVRNFPLFQSLLKLSHFSPKGFAFRVSAEANADRLENYDQSYPVHAMCQNLWDGRAGETCHFVLWSTSYEQKLYDGIQQLRAKCHIRLKNLFICRKTRTSPMEIEILTTVASIVAWGNDVLWEEKRQRKL